MDYIKLAQRTIAMLSSMIESGEYHTTRSKEMKDNALNGLEQLRIHGVVGRSEQLVCSCSELPNGEIAISSKALQKPYGDLGQTDC